MSHPEILNREEQDILLWVAESEIGTFEPTNVTVADRPAFDWVSAVVDQLVKRGLLGRDFIGSVGDDTSLHGLCVYLTDRGAQAVVDLWRQRCSQQAPGVPPLH